MVYHAVFAGVCLPSLGQLVDQVHVPGKTPGAADASHRGQAAEVYSDADGNVPLLGRSHYFAHLVFISEVPRVQAQAIHAAFGALQRQLVVEVNISYQWNADLFLDFRHCLGGFHVGNRTADYFAARFFELVDLPDRRGHVPGVGLGHGLNGDVSAAAYLYAAHVNRFGWPTFVKHSQMPRKPRSCCLDITRYRGETPREGASVAAGFVPVG